VSLKSERIVLKHASVICGGGSEWIADASVAIEDSKIAFVGPQAQIPIEYHEWPSLDLTRHIISPGLINSHSHVVMGFFRGLGHGKTNMIESFLFPAEKSLTPELIAPLCYSYIVDGLKSGVTSFVDHYYFSEQIAAAFELLGVRAWIGETIADLGGAFPGEDSFDRARSLIETTQFSSRIRHTLAPHASDTVSTSLMKKIVDYAAQQKLPIHMHLAQTKGEFDRVMTREQKTPVRWAYDLGALTHNTLAVHLTNVTEQDISILEKSKATWGWCPSSTVIYDRLAQVSGLFEAEILPAIGTDCAASCDHSDVMSELRTAFLFAKDRGVSGEKLSCDKLLAMATTTPAKVLGVSSELGQIKAGMLADLVVHEVDVATKPIFDPLTNLIFSAGSRNVKHVMIDGHWRLWNRQLPHIDLNNLNAQHDAAVATIVKRTGHSL
jgi:5-methylthioadenosine/S-adenosylhomocysteine deaminase